MYLDILQRVGAEWQTLNLIRHVLCQHPLPNNFNGHYYQRFSIVSQVVSINPLNAPFPQILKVMVDKKKIAGKSKGKAPVSQVITMAKCISKSGRVVLGANGSEDPF